MSKTLIVLSSCLLCGGVLAEPASYSYVLGLSAGPAWTTGNTTQTVTLEPDVVKAYTAANNRSAFPGAELFIAWQKNWFSALLQQSILGQLGLSIAGAGNAKMSGDIWEDADPRFDNSTYNYKVNHIYVGIKGRLVGVCYPLLQPYLSAGIGVGFNHAYDFTTHPNISEEVAVSSFQSNTISSFSYTLGVGFQQSFGRNLQVAIGYEFADWGKTQLARAPGQTVNHGLTLNHLYANQLQLSLYYMV